MATNMDEVMAQITALGENTPEYHEALWFLFSVLARREASMAERMRANARRNERRRIAREVSDP